MKTKFIAFFLLLFISPNIFGQKIQDGTFIYNIRDAEYEGGPIVAKCKVIIKGKKIKVIYLDSSLTNIKYGDIFEEGIIMKHLKTKKWIIGHSKKDIYAKEVGGCSDGPVIIDLIKKEIWNC